MEKNLSLAEIFAANLRYYRTNHSPPLTQEKLSELVGKNQNYIGLLETGKSHAPLKMIERLAQTLGVEASCLLSKTGSPENTLKFHKDDLVDLLTTEILERLQKTLRQDISEALAKK